MFTPAERDDVRRRLLERARADPRIAAAAVTGSFAAGASDPWSDIDLAFGVADDAPMTEVIEEWSGWMARELGAIHWWDVPFDVWTYRVFLLPGLLEVDLAFVPVRAFRALAPTFQLVFGEAREPRVSASPSREPLVGTAWHHALHARASIARGRPWQALHLLDGMRDAVLGMACLRRGLPAAYGRGADRLPQEDLEGLESCLATSLDAAELTRALGATVDAFVRELRRSDPTLTARLEGALGGLVAPQDEQ